MKQKISLLTFLFLCLFSAVLAQHRKTRIACIGNSVTYGYGLRNPQTQSYPALLQQKMGSRYDVRNFGHSGATLLKRGHNPYYKTTEFAAAVKFKPDIAVIHLGLNDTDPRDWPDYRDDFIPDYNWLIDTLRAVNPAMKIYICRLTPIFTGHPRFLSSTFDWYWDVQSRIAGVAAINHTGLIDLYEAFHDRPDLFTDAATLHPNTAGAKKLCGVIYENITGDFGGLKIADIFTDNMVLQRGKPIPVWGTANAGTKVVVTFHGIVKTVITPADGKWKVFFPAEKGSFQTYTLQIKAEDSEVTFGNILAGDIWLCAGQSNMAFPLAAAEGGMETARQADGHAALRLFNYKPYATTGEVEWDSVALAKADNLDFFSGEWKMNTKDAAKGFSAVGYYFGQKILQEEKIPVGLIEVAVGGSPLISWVDRLTLEADPLFEPALHDWRHSDYIMGWCRERAALNLKNAVSPFQRHPYDPCFNFEAGIANITQFPVKGVIWYQGESDAENPELFGKLFPVFVKDWRRQWGYDFPLYYVQLSSLDRPSWNYFRDAQRELLAVVPNTGMAVSSDLGDRTNVHYTDKRPVGLRLAYLALHGTYGEREVVPNGPLAAAAVRRGGRIVITFSQGRGLAASDGRPLRGFEVLDDKGYLSPVSATIEDGKVYLPVPENKVIQKVVYGWEPYTTANLVNGAGLPASTFMLKVK